MPVDASAEPPSPGGPAAAAGTGGGRGALAGSPPGEPFPADSGPAPGPDHGPDHPWTSCVLPLAAFMALEAIEPSRDGGGLAGILGIPFSAYPAAYAVRMALTIALVAWRWRSIRPWLGRPSWWPPLLGLALVIPWVALAGLQRDAGWQGWLFGMGARAAFDPFEAWGEGSTTALLWLVVRGFGLVVLIPLVEELFLRGFLMRYVVDEDFRRVPFGLVTPAAAAVCAAWAIFSHPAEAGAALAWFAVVTGIAAATRRPIDCILAHAATNLALGAWVLATGDWWLV